MQAKARSLVVLLSALAACGCADLKGVKKFSEDTTTLTGTVAVLIQDTGDSCRRRLTTDVTIRKLSAEDLKTRQAGCDDLGKAASAIGDLNNVDLAYAKALGALADDKLVVYTAEVGEVKTSVAQLKDGSDKPYVDSSKLDAAGSLADLVLKAFTESYRQRQISNMLNAHDDLAKQADVLKLFIQRGYLPTLKNENDNLESALLDLERFYGKTEPLRAGELKNDFEQMQKKLADRKTGAEGAVKALDKMVQTHQKLRDEANDWKSQELLDLLDGYGKQITDVRKKLRAAF